MRALKIILFILILLVIMTICVKVSWLLITTTVFPGAVEQGFVNPNMPWHTGLIIIVLLLIFTFVISILFYLLWFLEY